MVPDLCGFSSFFKNEISQGTHRWLIGYTDWPVSCGDLSVSPTTHTWSTIEHQHAWSTWVLGIHTYLCNRYFTHWGIPKPSLEIMSGKIGSHFITFGGEFAQELSKRWGWNYNKVKGKAGYHWTHLWLRLSAPTGNFSNVAGSSLWFKPLWVWVCDI